MIVSIDGNIGSGKSSIVRELQNMGYLAFPEPIERWTFLDAFYRDKRANALKFSLQVLSTFENPFEHDGLVVTERSPLTNREVFAKMHASDGTMDVDEWEMYKKFHAMLGWEPHAMVYVHAPAQTCFERVKTRARGCEHDIELEYLERLEKSYDTLIRFVEFPVIRVDATLPLDVVTRSVVDAIETLTRNDPN